MSNPVGLEHVGIPASNEDFDEVVDFYQSVFGWKVLRRLDGAPRLAFIGDGYGGRIEVLTSDGEPLSHPSHLAFAVPIAEFNTLKDRLTASNAEFLFEQQNQAGDSLAFYNDPHGNCFQIVGRIKPLE